MSADNAKLQPIGAHFPMGQTAEKRAAGAVASDRGPDQASDLVPDPDTAQKTAQTAAQAVGQPSGLGPGDPAAATQAAITAPLAAAPVLAALPMPVLLIGADGRILALNPAASALVPMAAEGRDYIMAIRQPALLDAVEDCLAKGARLQSRYLGRSGARDTTWRVAVAPLPLAEGQGALLSFEDVTAVEEAEQMRRDFVANVSHELRTPLTSLLGFVETLRGPARNDPEARERFLAIMEGEATRMAQLVRDLLSLGRVEAEERLRPTQNVALQPLLRGVAQVLDPVARAKGNSIVLDLPEDEIAIPADADQLRQVVTNLIENALKYGGPDRPVTVSLGAPQHEPMLRGRAVRLTVSDSGPGIARHHIPRLTERFYRVDSHRAREVGGTGLGLAIVKHIINRHRGRLRIDSTLGSGSHFTVILPALDEGA